MIAEVIEVFRKRRSPAAVRLEDLDPDTQRRVILQVVRRHRPEDFEELRKSQPTLSTLETDIRESFWVAVFFCWTVVVPIAALCHLYGQLRLRNLVRREYAAVLDEPDLDAEFYVAEGAIRRLVKALPRAQRKHGRTILRELGGLVKRWDELRRRKHAALTSGSVGRPNALFQRRLDLEARIELEQDPVVRESLRRQLTDIRGQLESHQGLEEARGRLEAVQSEILECLQHLRTRLGLISAQGLESLAEAVPESVERLHGLNRDLKATTDATQEVMRLGRGS